MKSRTKRRLAEATYISLLCIVFFLSLLIVFAVKWVLEEYGGVSLSQLIFHIKVPAQGTESSVITNFVKNFLCDSLPIFIIFLIFLVAVHTINRKDKYECFVEINYNFKGRRSKKIKLMPIFRFTTAFLVVAYFCFSLNLFYRNLGIEKYIKDMNDISTIYEENYIDPADVEITFPKNKKNLIYIFCESMENTFSSIEFGGAMEQNLIPNLTEIAFENQSFSQSNRLNGASYCYNTTWTAEGLVAQTSGIPLSIPIEENSYGDFSTFLPGVTSLGEVLEKADYNQMIMFGSDAEFGGRKNYFLQHGNYEIYDIFTAKKKGKIPQDYKEWWGFEDEKLFEYAKEEILNLAAKDEPFNFTMLTADTHHPDGYTCRLCRAEHDLALQNVISCADRQISDFVAWMQQQDFYDDTVIIISGDHSSMSSTVPKMYNDQSYERRTYFTIINSDTKSNYGEGERIFTRLDLFPTTLASLGCTIEGDKLGLGTNLYSAEKTLPEKITLDVMNSELEKNSNFYNEKLLFAE